MFQIHNWDDTGTAYDDCNIGEHAETDKAVRSGDVCVIEKEGVVGFAWAWPVAITLQHHNFHVTTNPVHIVEKIPVSQEALHKAVEVVKSLNLQLHPDWAAYLGGDLS